MARIRRPWRARRSRGRGCLALLALIGAFVALPTAPAFAGRLLVTGHDADLHCSGQEQCHFVEVATRYVRGGAPDPSKPVLVLDRLGLAFPTALNNAFGANGIPRVVMDPRSPEFAREPLTTDRYSAILVASDVTCGGCDLNEFDSTPDSDAINARKADIEAFFNAGGGIFANSGASHGDGDPQSGPDTYYSFLPLPAAGRQVQPPFCLTDEGKALGFEDPIVDGGCPDVTKRNGTRDDINCCATHNSFQEPPSGSRLRVAERDASGAPETLFGEGVIRGGALSGQLPPPTAYSTANVALVSGVVTIKRPGQATFTLLTGEEQIPLGSSIDTRLGTVGVTTTADLAGQTQSGNFSQGLFALRQLPSPGRGGRARPVTELKLGGPLRASRALASRVASAARRRARRLFGSARGRFRSRGRYSSATVRGTDWLVEDQTGGTLTVVRTGSVTVRDFVRRRTVVVRAGRRYLARARGR